MNRLLTNLTLALVLACVSGVMTSAQTPFASSEGLPTAQSIAQDSLGSDAALAIIFTTGADPITGGPAFAPETGESALWAYLFYSPSSGRNYAHILFQVAPGLFAGAGQSGEPDSAAIPLITASHAYSGSDQMMARIRANSDY